jgi:hypothetical protein
MSKQKSDLLDAVLPGIAQDGRFFFESTVTGRVEFSGLSAEAEIDKEDLLAILKRGDIGDIPRLVTLIDDLDERLRYYRKEAWYQWQWHHHAIDYVEHLSTVALVQKELMGKFLESHNAQSLPPDIGKRAPGATAYFQCILSTPMIEFKEPVAVYQPYVEAKRKRDDFKRVQDELRKARQEIERLKAGG